MDSTKQVISALKQLKSKGGFQITDNLIKSVENWYKTKNLPIPKMSVIIGNIQEVILYHVLYENDPIWEWESSGNSYKNSCVGDLIHGSYHFDLKVSEDKNGKFYPYGSVTRISYNNFSPSNHNYYILTNPKVTTAIICSTNEYHEAIKPNSLCWRKNKNDSKYDYVPSMSSKLYGPGEIELLKNFIIF